MNNGIINDESKAIAKFIEEFSKLNIAVVIKSFCDCGKPIDSRYAPCCSLKCWDKKFL
jgi:hypothetical protein